MGGGFRLMWNLKSHNHALNRYNLYMVVHAHVVKALGEACSFPDRTNSLQQINAGTCICALTIPNGYEIELTLKNEVIVRSFKFDLDDIENGYENGCTITVLDTRHWITIHIQIQIYTI